MLIYKEFRFEAAHFLPNVPPDHKCRSLHGHSYIVIIYIEGEVDGLSGWITDFGDIKKAIELILAELDHSVLNNIVGLENPTSENLSIWVWRKAKLLLTNLSKIEIRETASTGCIFEGD